MIIKALLIGIVTLLSVWLLINRSKAHARASTRLTMLCFGLIAVVAIIFPNVVNSLANMVGVGRGADLILYLLTMLFLFFSLSHYIRSKDEQRRFVALTRKVAILEANQLERNKNLTKTANARVK